MNKAKAITIPMERRIGMRGEYWRASEQKWVRSRGGWFAGVCQGLGERFDVDPMLLRLLWAVSIVFFGFGLLLYVLMAVVLPIEDEIEKSKEPKILGVCHRIALKTDMDVGLVRALSVLLAVASFGATIIGYIILNFILVEPKDSY